MRLYLPTPAFVSAALDARVSPEAAALLAAIPYAPTATVSLASLSILISGSMVRGYGFVVPRIEHRDLLAAHGPRSSGRTALPPLICSSAATSEEPGRDAIAQFRRSVDGATGA